MHGYAIVSTRIAWRVLLQWKHPTEWEGNEDSNEANGSGIHIPGGSGIQSRGPASITIHAISRWTHQTDFRCVVNWLKRREARFPLGPSMAPEVVEDEFDNTILADVFAMEVCILNLCSKVVHNINLQLDVSIPWNSEEHAEKWNSLHPYLRQMLAGMLSLNVDMRYNFTDVTNCRWMQNRLGMSQRKRKINNYKAYEEGLSLENECANIQTILVKDLDLYSVSYFHSRADYGDGIYASNTFYLSPQDNLSPPDENRIKQV